jgi:hypothetical protein
LIKPQRHKNGAYLKMQTISVNWKELEAAFERNAPNMSSYLDLETGKILVFVDGVPEDEQSRAVVLGDDERYLFIDPASSREQYRWMEHFVASIDDETLQERLIIAIDGKGAFRRFKDVLLHYPHERERWFNYRADRLHAYINEWLEAKEIETETPPPWGTVELPQEPEEELPKPLLGSMSPAEVLRRQAKELIDVIPAVDLTSALAFLEFLRDRGSAALTVQGRENLKRRTHSR